MPTFDTPQPISVSLEIGVGDIQIAASDRADTVVEVRPTDPQKAADVHAAEQTRVEYANGRLTVKAPRSWKQYTFRGGGESVDVRIELPAGSEVAAESAIAAVRGTGRLGECRLRTGAGDIELDAAAPARLRTGAGDIIAGQVAGHAEVTTGTGAVSIAAVDGTAEIKNSNGDTRIGKITGDLRVNAANGSISIHQSGAAVAAKTAKGDISLGEVSSGDIVAETAFGKITIGIAGGVAAWLDLHTRFGNVRNELDAAGQPGPGEDAVEVRARTSYGDIAVARSDARDERA